MTICNACCLLILTSTSNHDSLPPTCRVSEVIVLTSIQKLLTRVCFFQHQLSIFLKITKYQHISKTLFLFLNPIPTILPSKLKTELHSRICGCKSPPIQQPTTDLIVYIIHVGAIQFRSIKKWVKCLGLTAWPKDIQTEFKHRFEYSIILSFWLGFFSCLPLC